MASAKFRTKMYPTGQLCAMKQSDLKGPLTGFGHYAVCEEASAVFKLST